MEINDYSKRKSEGFIELVKLGEAVAIVQKKFDPNTGKELPSEVQALDIKSIENQQIILKDQVSQIDALLSDMKKLLNVKGGEIK